MRDIILWFVAVFVVGILAAVAEKLLELQGKFALVFRIMCGILAFVFFVLFIVAVLKYTNLMPVF